MSNTKGRTARNKITRAGWLALPLIAPLLAVQLQAAEPTVHFAIDAGPLQKALIAYAAATGLELLYSSEMVAGRQAPALVGDLTPEDGLVRLLDGSGLTARRVGAKVFVLRTVDRPGQAVSSRGGQADPVAGQPAMSGLAIAPTAAVAESGAINAAAANNPDIVVTGTHIRGRNPGTPPVTTITRDDLTKNGYATVAQALQALPGNFGGVATEQSALSFIDTSGTNAALSTGVDLRGLGPGATLVLVNGQRLGGSGSEGAFTDVSSIPTGAVDRVEVLMDGASAIYGSDAVGGVVNILLKRRFDGAETRARLGTVTSGDKRDVQIDQTVGKQWATGGIMLSYEYDRQGRLASKDRDFAANADLRPLGGGDHRYVYSLPGNILGVDPATGIYGVAYAIPGGQDGTDLTPANFLPGVSNLENRREGSDLIPRQTRHSVYATLDQDLSDTLHFTADGRYSHRAFAANEPGAAAIVEITAANPHYVPVGGAPYELIAYSMEPELGPIQTHGYAESISASAGLNADLGGEWKLRSYAAFAQERERNHTDHEVNSAALNEALGNTPDNPATPFSTAAGGYFNPYGTGTSNSATILDFVGDGYDDYRTRSRILTGHVDADGTLLTLPGGKVRLAVGGDVRREDFRTSATGLFSSATPVSLYESQDHRAIEAAFAEVHVPLFGADNARAGLRQLDLSVAGRIEHYAEFGTTTNPKVGVSWVPVKGLTLRSDYGTSFRAPNLRELSTAQEYVVTTVQRADGAAIPVIQLSGGNPDLKPETARSWTAGFDLEPAIIPHLQLSLTWFRTIFSSRIARPASDDFANALTDPALAPFVELVSPNSNAADLAKVTALYSDPAFGGANGFPPTSIGAIIDTRYVNTGKVDVSGLDLTAHYSVAAGANRFVLGANGSYLLRYREQVTPTSSSVDERNLVGHPVDLRGRLDLGWTRGVANATLGLNYVAPYRDLLGNHIDAWKTVDLVVGVTAPDTSRLHGFAIAIVADNLFDKAPPFYDSPIGLGYDAANADALGRFVSVQLTKRW